MKRVILILAGLVASFCLNAQSVGVGTDTPNENAALHVHSADGDQGVLVPRLKDASLVAMAATFGTAETGMLVFNVDDGEFQFWTGTVWETVGASGGSGDDLGDHITDTNIVLGGNYLSGDGDDEGITVDASGNVNIGTTNTTATEITGTLDVSSNVGVAAVVTANDFDYSSRQDRIKSIPAAAWRIGSDNSAVMLANFNEVGLQSGISQANIIAPLDVPHLSQLTDVRCYVSNTSGFDAELRLYIKYNETTQAEYATVNVPGGQIDWVEITTGSNTSAGAPKLPWSIDNEKFNYYLYFDEDTPNAGITIRGCHIVYNVASPD